MLQQLARVGSILLVASLSLYAMNVPTLKDIASKKVAQLIASNLNPSYCVKAFDTLPRELDIYVIQQLVRTNSDKSALPIIVAAYKYYQQQSNNKHRQIHLTCLDNKQVLLIPEQSKELVQNSATIQNLIQDIEEQVEEIPLPLLTQEQVITLLSYISSLNALNTSDSTLPMLQQEMPEITALSSYWIKYTALQQLKEHLATQTIPMLCDLLIAASYLDIQSNEQVINLVELATQTLGNKLLQSSIYQEEYSVINTLPNSIQLQLVRYLIDTSAVRYALCSNSTDVIESTAQTLTGHTNSINAVSWSPDGKHIASSSDDTKIRIWNTATGMCMYTLTEHTNWVNAVSWSPDSKYIASGSGDKTIKIWDASTGTCMHTLTGHTEYVWSVAWSVDSKHIASCSFDRTIKIWDACSGICIYTLKGHTNSVVPIAWSPDGKYIASGSDDKTIKIWNTSTGTCVHTLKGHTDWINSVSWSPDGKYIASGSWDNTIKIWHAVTGTCINTLEGHTNYIWSVSWSPDSNQLVSSSDDKTIRIWSINTGACVHILRGHTDWVSSVSWSPYGKYIASCSCDKTIKIWNAQNGTCIPTLTGHTAYIWSVAWSPDGSMIASGSSDNTVKLWHIIDKNLYNHLKTTISWEQALLIARIVNQHNIDFIKDERTLHCYNGLSEKIKQRVKLLSRKTQATTYTIKNFLEAFRTIRSLWYWLAR